MALTFRHTLFLSFLAHVALFAVLLAPSSTPALPVPFVVSLATVEKQGDPNEKAATAAPTETEHVQEAASVTQATAVAPTEEAASGETSGSYGLLIRRKIETALDYPKSLQRRGVQGHVDLALRLAPSGAVTGMQAQGGPPELEKLAREAVRRAEPFAPFEGRIAKLPEVLIRIPLEFRIL